MPLPTKSDVALVNPVLTDLSLGYQNQDAIWNKLAPPTGRDRNVGTFPIYTRDYWFRRVTNAKRGESGGYTRTGYGIGTDTYETVEIGFEKALDDSIKAASQLGEDLQTTDVAFLTGLMELELEMRIAAAGFVTGVWATSTVLAGTDQWSDYDGSDPIAKIDVAIRTIRRNTGAVPNTIIVGALAWEKLKEHPLIVDKYKYTQKGIMTPELVAAVLGVPELLVGNAIYNAAAEKAPGTASFTGTDIWTDNCLILCRNNPAQRVQNGSFTFIWEENFKQPWVVETYRDESVRSDITRIRTHVDPKIVSTQHGYLYLDCVA